MRGVSGSVVIIICHREDFRQSLFIIVLVKFMLNPIFPLKFQYLPIPVLSGCDSILLPERTIKRRIIGKSNAPAHLFHRHALQDHALCGNQTSLCGNKMEADIHFPPESLTVRTLADPKVFCSIGECMLLCQIRKDFFCIFREVSLTKHRCIFLFHFQCPHRI